MKAPGKARPRLPADSAPGPGPGGEPLGAAAALLRAAAGEAPPLALVLGSGFAGVLGALQSAEAELAYAELPGFVPTTVSGHPGRVVVGRLGGGRVCLLAGRAHYYEGHELSGVTFPVRVLARWGVRELLLTNAAGGIHPRLRPGDFLVLTDHINFLGANPLRGLPPEANGPAFVDLTAVYDVELARCLMAAGRTAGVPLRRGVYLAVSGPSYETPAEIRAFARLGADAVGMSTVPEAIVARHCGLRVAGLSCITNRAAGLSREPISHAEVLARAAQNRDRAARLLTEFVRRRCAAGR